jgi:protein ImuA
MSIPLHTALSPRSRPAQTLLAPLTLARGRVHEFCGPARVTLAAFLLRETTGAVIWAYPGWQAERLFPDGLLRHADPGRIVLAAARRPEDLLWTMEEALRSGAAPLVVAELAAPPALTPVRRLHLAAEAGAAAAAHAGRAAPLGLLLTPGAGGAAGVESRWQLTSCHDGSTARWRLARLRARAEPPKDWLIGETNGRLRLDQPEPADPTSA